MSVSISKHDIAEWLRTNHPEALKDEGQCGVLALLVFLYFTEEVGVASAEIVHGYPRHATDGHTFWHAWVEFHDRVFDYSLMYQDNDDVLVHGMPRERYYSLGHIQRDNTRRFDTQGVTEAWKFYDHAGPWDGSSPPMRQIMRDRAAQKKKEKARKRRKLAKRNK